MQEFKDAGRGIQSTCCWGKWASSHGWSSISSRTVMYVNRLLALPSLPMEDYTHFLKFTHERIHKPFSTAADWVAKSGTFLEGSWWTIARTHWSIPWTNGFQVTLRLPTSTPTSNMRPPGQPIPSLSFSCALPISKIAKSCAGQCAWMYAKYTRLIQSFGRGAISKWYINVLGHQLAFMIQHIYSQPRILFAISDAHML